MFYQKNKVINFLKAYHFCFFILGSAMLFLTSSLNTFAQTQAPTVTPPKIAPSIPGSPLATDSTTTSTAPATTNSGSGIQNGPVSTSSVEPVVAAPKTENPTPTPQAQPVANNIPSQEFLPKETPRSGGLESLALAIPAAGFTGLVYFYKKNVYQQKKKLTTTENRIKNHL